MQSECRTWRIGAMNETFRNTVGFKPECFSFPLNCKAWIFSFLPLTQKHIIGGKGRKIEAWMNIQQHNFIGCMSFCVWSGWLEGHVIQGLRNVTLHSAQRLFFELLWGLRGPEESEWRVNGLAPLWLCSPNDVHESLLSPSSVSSLLPLSPLLALSLWCSRTVHFMYYWLLLNVLGRRSIIHEGGA